MVESLWSIPNTESLRSPLAILREQATALTEQTRGTLIGVAEALSRQASNVGDVAIGKDVGNFLTGSGSAVLGQQRLGPQSGELNLGLSIQVPALNDYKYRLLTYRQPVTMYPGTLSFPLKNLDYAIGDEEQFLAALAEILSSPEVRSLLASLLAQATDS